MTVNGATPGAAPRGESAAGWEWFRRTVKAKASRQDAPSPTTSAYSRLAPYSTLGFLNLGRRRARGAGLARTAPGESPLPPNRKSTRFLAATSRRSPWPRILHQDADVLLLDEPTRGIDVGTKAEIYRLVGELAAAGKAIIFVSSYLPELMAICDRIGVMVRGKLRHIRPTAQWTEEEVMALATGIEDA